ncbi:hemin-degrading factor [Paralimibaculum aggregatum]|uniref:Hemin-degrading factor n=1 Tax=Paralimibaculum aggregatum TaxID=3036245 RepID=A0ABQ6LP74_9RHOB|nr:ChuX/HutX family heme-like substrate-binding protein [Limibaculum sp. NKW23]GMG83527.1 hemin-degrading factor [Limibaculum sp. NKW23]
MPDTPEMPAPRAPADLLAAWRAAKAENPGLRARDLARSLAVPEAALLEARIGAAEGVARLAPEGTGFAPLMAALPALGPVMTLARNEAAVHETRGPLTEVGGEGAIGQVTGPIDLRLFYRRWHVGYRVSEETRSGLRHSLQIFDAAGTAVLKLHAQEGTDMAAFERVAADFADTAGREIAFAPPAAPQPDRPDAEIDRAALRDGWRSLSHSHDFFRLLHATGAGRLQALRLAGADLARAADAGAAQRMLEAAAAAAVPIMCFVGNAGCIQIFSGRVERIVMMGPWLNVLDPGFNLHLRTDLVASAWLVTKPTTTRGPITSLELFDAAGTMVCQFFGARPPGQEELPEWRALVTAAAGPAA